MARPLQVLSLLSRLGALSVTPSLSTNSCRFVSRGVGKAWMGQSHVHRDRNRAPRYSDEVSDEDRGLEDVEDKLQALVDAERKRQKTVKYHILRRQMTPSGAPERKLTWEAIEQIRYLKQEQPEEWTVERLAEGFSVTPNVILRVLRSKFIPAPERKARQDANVMSGLSQQVLPSGAGTRQDRLKLPGNRAPAALPSGSREGGLVPLADRTLMTGGKGSASVAKSPAPVAVLPPQFTEDISKDATVTIKGEDSNSNTNPAGDDKEDEESWDGQVLSEEELEELMDMKNPSPVVQVGNDFLDAEGNFLYRI
ncbi:neugrin [Thunnus thynnus]|uniref:neugrin n=1 Tax=Thunnus thynnus TaxID=8237 RepID=UPI003527B108